MHPYIIFLTHMWVADRTISAFCIMEVIDGSISCYLGILHFKIALVYARLIWFYTLLLNDAGKTQFKNIACVRQHIIIF